MENQPKTTAEVLANGTQEQIDAHIRQVARNLFLGHPDNAKLYQ
jgi:hypothetical protein